MKKTLIALIAGIALITGFMYLPAEALLAQVDEDSQWLPTEARFAEIVDDQWFPTEARLAEIVDDQWFPTEVRFV